MHLLFSSLVGGAQAPCLIFCVRGRLIGSCGVFVCFILVVKECLIILCVVWYLCVTMFGESFTHSHCGASHEVFTQKLFVTCFEGKHSIPYYDLRMAIN